MATKTVNKTKAVKAKVKVKALKSKVKAKAVKPKIKAKAGGIKKKSGGKSVDLKSLENDLIRDLKSTMFDGRSSIDSVVSMDKSRGKSSLDGFFKKMVLKCKSCNGDFKHKADVKPFNVEVSCPHCDDVHTIHFMPASKLFHVHSSTLSVKKGK